VDDAAVVARLMFVVRRLFLDVGEFEARVAPQQLAGSREPTMPPPTTAMS